MNKFKLILYELNEIPRQLIDYYIKLRPYSNFSKIVESGFILNTYTTDEEELHPWSTWPTVHRGVDNKIHKIRFINQDLKDAEKFPPIWEIIAKNNIDIGIFGSLQSYPPKLDKNVSFYLPDTFAPKPCAYPRELEYFQSFNIDLVSQNKAVAGQFKVKNVLKFLNLLKNRTISLSSAYQAILHIFKEIVYIKYKTRRSMLQPIIAFDLFFNYLNKSKPSFTTFFTNHLAGMMHRYWIYLFPSDFDLSKKQIDNFFAKSIIKAMDIADDQLGRLLLFSEKENYNLWIISSMGQKAIDRGKYIPEIILNDLSKLIEAFGLNKNSFELMPAMQPDICIACDSLKSLKNLRDNLKFFKDSSGNRILDERYDPVGLRLNITINSSLEAANKGQLYLRDKKFFLRDLGLGIITRDKGTAYHSPEGVFLGFGHESLKLFKNKSQPLNTCEIAPIILDLFDLDLPEYMNYKKNN